MHKGKKEENKKEKNLPKSKKYFIVFPHRLFTKNDKLLRAVKNYYFFVI